MQIGIVKGREVKKNRTGQKNVFMLQVQLSEKDDIQTVELISQTGEENNPPNGSRVIVSQVGNAFKIALVSSDKIEPTTEPGEKLIYSTDKTGETIQASILFKNDGTVVINGGSDNAVRYSALLSAFNQLMSDYNSHLAAHSGISASTADITGAKVNEVAIP